MLTFLSSAYTQPLPLRQELGQSLPIPSENSAILEVFDFMLYGVTVDMCEHASLKRHGFH